MTRKDFVELIYQVERSIPVSDWTYGDIHIWPIVKKDIFFNWADKQADKAGDERHTVIVRKSSYQKIALILKSLYKYIQLAFSSSRSIDILFAGASSHRTTYQNKFINRYFYPVYFKNKSAKYLQLEYGKKAVGKDYDDTIPMLYLMELFPFFLLSQKFKKKQAINIPGWDQVVQAFSSADVKINKHTVISQLNSITAQAHAFNFILKKVRPEKIYSLCYYKNEMFALCYVAHKLNIPCYDVQHGGQGYLHPMYTFYNLPDAGYNTLPQIFWTWDKASSDHILSWSQSQSYHQVEENKNPWIQYQIEMDRTTNLDQKKIILYTLQEAKLDDYIVEAIQNTPEDFIWWLRLHPRKMHAKETILLQLNEAGGKTVEIDKACEISLPIILKNARVHISKFSGSIIESVQIGTPTIVIDKIGVDTYSEYVSNGSVKTAITGNAQELLNVINNI